MSTSTEKLSHDLAVLQEMILEMESYLGQETLFWSMRRGGLPKLTLGGMLLRVWRLRHLADLLPPDEKLAARTAINRFDQIARDNVVRFEARAHEELAARVRQWAAHLRDMRQEVVPSYYATAVATRAIIAHLVNQLRQPPFNLEKRWPDQLSLLDQQLAERWQVGDFVWPAEWEAAYPKPEFWWLYGLPRPVNSGR
jgi:hypothetical protein